MCPLNLCHRPKAICRAGNIRIPRPMKNKGKENSNKEWGTVDKESIKKLTGILALSAPPAGKEGGATGAFAIAA